MKKLFLFLLVLLGVTGAFALGWNVHIVGEIKNINPKFSIEISTEQKPAVIETEEGTVEDEDIITVESVDGGIITDCPEENEECAKGAILPPLDITSPFTFYNSVIDQCIDFDGAYGSQCYDEMAYFHYVYTGRWLSTSGTGAAYGIWDARDYNNPVNPETNETYYELIYDAKELQPGDFAIFSGGIYGHVGEVTGTYNNGYITLLGTNQGGRSCPGGGSAANVININLGNFRGAFRPRIWIKKEPAPLPISNCVKWHVLQGDTMGKIMMECEGTIKYGEIMNEYAKTWYSLIVKPGQSVYDGWISPSGVGLYDNDDIEHRI